MSTRVSYFITCDICGESAGHSHTESVARQEVRRHGWVRVRDVEGKLVDMCWRCAERAEMERDQQREDIRNLKAALAATNARVEVAEAELAAWRRRSTKAERHVELLKKELDSVPVAALSILADAVDDTPDDVTQWLAWAELGALWQPAEQPCPDCGADALVVAIHADGTIEQWLCQECGYVAAEKSEVQP